jgi:colicin import membrane protein
MQSYRVGFISSISLHLFLLLFFSVSLSTKPKVYISQKPKTEIVKAVSLDSDKINAEIHRIKQQKEVKAKQELERQQQLKRQARLAKQRRIKEQRRLNAIKRQAKALALKQKRQRVLEQKRLAKLKQQKLKQQQELARIEKQKAVEQKRIADIKAKERLALEKKQKEQALLKQRKEQQARRLAEQKAERERNAKLMGEVNKYKALIISAISQNWILPDNVDKSLSSKFEIRLAPGGSVMSVKLLRSSGDPVLDRSAQTAIYRASPLPVPSAPDAFKLFRVVSLTVKPETIVQN